MSKSKSLDLIFQNKIPAIHIETYVENEYFSNMKMSFNNVLSDQIFHIEGTKHVKLSRDEELKLRRKILNSIQIFDGKTSKVAIANYNRNKIIIKFTELRKHKETFNEITILKKINHENIIKLLDTFHDNFYFITILEYTYEYDLLDYILMDKLNMKDALYIFKKLASAVKYLHLNKITHRDIKPDNIVYSPITNKVVLFDFGLSDVHSARPIITNNMKGTLDYLAPEARQYYIADPYKLDVYALGMTYFVCINKRIPKDVCDFKYIRGWVPINRKMSRLIELMITDLVMFRPDIESVYNVLSSLDSIIIEHIK